MGDFELLSADEINGWKMLLFNVFIVPSQGKLFQRKRLNGPTASDLSTLSLPAKSSTMQAAFWNRFRNNSSFSTDINVGFIFIMWKNKQENLNECRDFRCY